MNPVIENHPDPTLRARVTAKGLRLSVRPMLAYWPMRPNWLRMAMLLDLMAPLALPAPRWATVEKVRFRSFHAEWVRAPKVDAGRVVLYFHGGGFMLCGLRTHRRMVARISAASGAPALSIAYRQHPAAPLATSVADCVEAYRWLLEKGYVPEQVVMAGDSAGGFLSLAVPLQAIKEGLPAPGGIVALSPLTDLDHTAKVAHDNALVDAYIPSARLARMVTLITEGVVPVDPMLSPVNADLAKLPPVLIQVGSTEVLRIDAEVMAERLAAAGVPCRLQIWDGQVHVFQAFADLVPEGLRAIREIGTFIRERTARQNAKEIAA